MPDIDTDERRWTTDGKQDWHIRTLGARMVSYAGRPGCHTYRQLASFSEATYNPTDSTSTVTFGAEPEFRDALGEAFAGHREKVILTAHLGAAVKGGALPL